MTDLQTKYLKKQELPNHYQGIVEQIIRPTGLLDPEIELRPIDPDNFDKLENELLNSDLDNDIKNELLLSFQRFSKLSEKQPVDHRVKSQVLDLLDEIQIVVQKKQRAFVTTLTKRMSEELTEYLKEKGVKVQYLHSDLDAIERVEILRDLRLGLFDVVVGINLLREGLDIPEVSLVAILDADKEGFLRSKTSLIQTIGRAARHENGKVLMYADHLTDSIKFAISETYRRRKIQIDYNAKNNIVPHSIVKEIKSNAVLQRSETDNANEAKILSMNPNEIVAKYKIMNKKERKSLKEELKFQMELFADEMNFEEAAKIRDVLKELN